MSATIDLPIPRDYPKRNDEIRQLAEHLAKNSIVTQALERYLIQVMTEVHDTQIKPLRDELSKAKSDAIEAQERIAELEKALRQIKEVGTRTTMERVGDMYAEDGYEEYATFSEEAIIADAALTKEPSA